MVGPPSAFSYECGATMSGSDRSEGQNGVGCLLRLFWMVIGNFVLVLCVIGMAQQGTGGLGLLDVLYWATAAAVLAARYADVAVFHGRTSDDRQATLADWRRHVLVLLPLAAIAWVAVRLLM